MTTQCEFTQNWLLLDSELSWLSFIILIFIINERHNFRKSYNKKVKNRCHREKCFSTLNSSFHYYFLFGVNALSTYVFNKISFIHSRVLPRPAQTARLLHQPIGMCTYYSCLFFFWAAALVIVLPSLFLIVFGAHLCIYTQVFRDLGYVAVWVYGHAYI